MIIKLVLSFILSYSTIHASLPVIGTVSKVKGKASALFIGSRDAVRVKKGMKIRKDTSILTGKRSFVQISFLDKSKISIGSSSKMVVDKVATTKAGFVTLLKGQVRSKVNKRKTDGEKLIIKTRTAALGVRGTDFRASFNPESKITNLITFSGNVALKKIKEQSPSNTKEVSQVQRAEDITKVFSDKDVVEVKQGKFSSVSSNLEKATTPVKISPVQYTRVKLNEELQEDVKPLKEEVYKQELDKTLKLYTKISKEEKTKDQNAQRQYSITTKTFRPTSGGLIDFNSGIYVPPSMKEDNYDKDLNIYKMDTQKGTITKSGEYVAPKGLKLDARQGFISTQKDMGDKSIVSLNEEIKAQLVKPKKPTSNDLEVDVEDSYNKYFKIR